MAALVALGLAPLSLSGQAASLLLSEATQAPLQGDVFAHANAEVIDLADMQRLRGGFAIGGVEMDFRVTLNSLISKGAERLGLTTYVEFTERGLQVTHAYSGLESGRHHFVTPGGGNSVTSITAGNDSVNIAGLADFSGIAITEGRQFTAALHQVTRKAILSAVVNNATGYDINHNINVELRVRNSDELRSAQRMENVMRSLRPF